MESKHFYCDYCHKEIKEGDTAYSIDECKRGLIALLCEKVGVKTMCMECIKRYDR